MRGWSIWRWLGVMAMGFVLTVTAYALADGVERQEAMYTGVLDPALCDDQARQAYRRRDPVLPDSGRQPAYCDPPNLLHLYITSIAGTVLFSIGFGGVVVRGFRSGGPGRTPLGQVCFGFGSVVLVVLMMIPVLEEAERAVCFIMCPPYHSDTFTAILVGYFFLSLLLLPIGILLVGIGFIRHVAAWRSWNW